MPHFEEPPLTLNPDEALALDPLLDAVRAIVSPGDLNTHDRTLSAKLARNLTSALEQWELASGNLKICPACDGEGFYERIVGSREFGYGYVPVTEHENCQRCQATGFIETQLDATTTEVSRENHQEDARQ